MSRTPQKMIQVNEAEFERRLREAECEDVVESIMSTLRRASPESCMHPAELSKITHNVVTPLGLLSRDSDDEEESSYDDDDDEETPTNWSTMEEQALLESKKEDLEEERTELLKAVPEDKRKRKWYDPDPGHYYENGCVRKRVKFTQLEKACIRNAVGRRGIGNWKSGKKDFGYILRNRTPGQIKDCFRTNGNQWGFDDE